MIGYSKKNYSFALIIILIIISPTHDTNYYETRNYENLDGDSIFDTSYSPKQSINNLDFRTDDILSGVLNEVGDKEGGRVCYPDCPSGWEEDEYDLWKVENSDIGGTLEVSISDIGVDDGTNAMVEVCFGNLGSMWCSEVLNGEEGGRFYVIDKIVLNSYIRISPEPSFRNDNVDYSIEIIDEFEDNNQLETMAIPYERSFSYSGYVCSEHCHDDNEEWSEFGIDFGDYYEILLLPNEEMLITINTEAIPNRGYIHLWLIYQEKGIDYVQKVTFSDQGEFEDYLKTDDIPITYTLIIASGLSNEWDGLTYEIKGELLWKNRMWVNNDYDLDGWTDIKERDDCGTDHLDYDSKPEDHDDDFICDFVDTDDDNDGWIDEDENLCETNPMSNQSIPSDFDNDMVCDFVDTDDDDDGVIDQNDDFPLDNSEWTDTDGDGIGNNADTDDDGDFILDNYDSFPLDSNEWADNDGDSIGNNADTDDDNDGWSDSDEIWCSTNSMSNQSIPGDFDNDMVCDVVDNDDDNDGIPDEEDIFPFDFNEWSDYNQDGIGDNEDSTTLPVRSYLSFILVSTIVIYLLNKLSQRSK